MSALRESYLSHREAAFGDVHSLEQRCQLLRTLAAVRHSEAYRYLTPAEACDLLREEEGVVISRQRAANILERERATGTVARKRAGGRLRYAVMQAGLAELARDAQPSRFVDPANALDEIRRLEEALEELRGPVSICDPYLENKTLDYLAHLAGASGVRFLTANILGDSKLRRDLAAFRKQYAVPLDIRVAPTGILHDRYVIFPGGMWMLGTSLNGYAKKQSLFVSLGVDIRKATLKAFEATWSKANAYV
jgi:hypothetical protein